MLFGIDPASIFIGLLLGAVFREIIPVEYQLWREKRREKSDELDKFYAEAVSIVNQYGIEMMNLQRKIDGPVDNSKQASELKQTQEFEKIEELHRDLRELVYGAPKDVDPEISHLLNTMAAKQYLGSREGSEWIDKEMKMIRSFNRKAANYTDRYQSNYL